VHLLAAIVAAAAAAAPQSSIAPLTADELPYSYRAGCPVAPASLRRVRLRYWGFDGAPHDGVLVVSVSATRAVVKVFARLYSARFPIRRMRPVDAYRGSDDRAMAADDTSAFNCRYAVAPGPKRWSVHAYGLAIDVNPVENPYVEGGKVRPAAGARYLDRTRVRRGMATEGGVLVGAFRSVGWYWGGRFRDYQHFSATGG
jgi:hypothetical protein